MSASILLVEDSPSLSRVYREYLRHGDYDVIAVDHGADALASIREKMPDVILLDLVLPDMHGMEILRSVKSHPKGNDCDVIVITSNGSVSVAVEAIRAGAKDFLVKPFTSDRLLLTLSTMLQHRKGEDSEDQSLTSDGKFVDFVGDSGSIQTVYRIIDQVAPSQATVFVTGESGTGKELCANAIHKLSPRRNRPLIALNCGAIPHELMESEIFGHLKGAFTGAYSDRDGAAHHADGGTLFLDEICDLSMDLQVKLLRFIQTGSFNRVGSTKLEEVDVRFVCATNKDPLEMVEKGLFREDLYYRLHVVPIEMPPLRGRNRDVLKIAEHILNVQNSEEGKTFKGFDENVQKVFMSYSWPGNVRQLENALRNMVVLNTGDLITMDMLPDQIRNWTRETRLMRRSTDVNVTASISMPTPQQTSSPIEPVVEPARPLQIKPLWQTEREAIEAAIDHCDGNIPRAARLLEVSPSTIYRKIQAWDAKDAKAG